MSLWFVPTTADLNNMDIPILRPIVIKYMRAMDLGVFKRQSLGVVCKLYVQGIKKGPTLCV